MPIPLIPLIGAGASILTNGMNAIAQGANNERARRFANWQYDKARADALADYNMQNEYNHPSSQMARLREAGLNPNLVYGNGADAQGATVRSTNQEGWNPRAIQYDSAGLQTGLMQYYDAQVKQAQVDNLRKQNTVMDVEAALKMAQIVGSYASTGQTIANTDKSKFELEQAQRMKDISYDAAEAQLNKILVESEATRDDTARKNELQRFNVSKAQLDIDNSIQDIIQKKAWLMNTEAQRDQIKAATESIQKDTRLKQLDIQLKEKGIQPSDPIYWRVLAQSLGSGTIGQSLKRFLP